MKKLALTLMAFAAAIQLFAAEGAWLTDFAAAEAKAAKEKKMVFMDFTGSDWCPPCMSLKKNVLDTKVFLDYAKENLVLVEVDFPNEKRQTDQLKAANEKLAKKFGVESYPTIIILDSKGKEVDRRIGFSPQSPAAYVEGLKKLKK